MEPKESWSLYLGLLLHKYAQEKRMCFWTVEDSLLVFFFFYLVLVTNWIFLYCIFSFHFANNYLLSLWLYLEPQVWLWIEVCLFFRDFVGIGILIFSGTQHDVRGLFSAVCNRAGFSIKKSQKIGIFEFTGTFNHLSFVNLVYNERLYFFL